MYIHLFDIVFRLILSIFRTSFVFVLHYRSIFFRKFVYLVFMFGQGFIIKIDCIFVVLRTIQVLFRFIENRLLYFHAVYLNRLIKILVKTRVVKIQIGSVLQLVAYNLFVVEIRNMIICSIINLPLRL